MGKSVGYLTIMFGANLKGFDKAMKKAQRSIGKFGASMQRTGETLTRNITLPVIGLGAAAIKMASDFEETSSKFKTVFSSIQKDAQRTAKEFKDSFGLSSQAAQQMLGDTGDLLVGFGFTEKEALNLSKQVNELAVDLASFTNFSGGAEGASLALTKALLGERESIKSLGIAITEADLKKFAQEQGLVFKELTRVEKATLTYQLAVKQSGKAIGDFQRTSGSFANQTRILAGDFKDLGVEIGTMLLPVAQKLLSWANGFVGAVRQMNPVLKQNIANFTLLAAAIGPLLSITGSLTKVFANLFSRTGIILVGLVALVGGFMYVRENYEAFKERLGNWVWWKNALIQVLAWLVEYNPFSFLVDRVNQLLRYLGKREIPNVFDSLAAEIEDLMDDTVEYEHQFGSLTDAIKNQSKDLLDVFGLLSNPFELGTPESTDAVDLSILHPFVAAPDPNEFIGPLNNELYKTKTILDQLIEAFGMTEESILKMGKSLGQSLSQGAENMKDYAKVVKNSIRETIGALISQGIAAAVSNALKSPGIAINPFLIPVIAGLAAGLARTAFNSLIPAFAEGGLVTGPTLGLVGEGVGTNASNPEVIAPLDRLKSMINGGNQQIEVYGRISGNDIFISNQRGGINRLRSV
tara:strand:+ start:1155 stop:3062 length:1908 start_codon:yes stop_codon:yes gene_type:complete